MKKALFFAAVANLTPELRLSLTKQVIFDLRGLSAEDMPDVIINIVQNL